MKRTLAALIAFLAIASFGCSLTMSGKDGSVSGSVGTSGQALSPAAQECAPNQYWDGDCCRHKGRGAGARKHDAPDCP